MQLMDHCLCMKADMTHHAGAVIPKLRAVHNTLAKARCELELGLDVVPPFVVETKFDGVWAGGLGCLGWNRRRGRHLGWAPATPPRL